MKQFIQRNFNVDIANELGLLAEVHKTQTSFLMDEKGNVIGIKIRAKQKRLKEEMQ
jgi:protein TonB